MSKPLALAFTPRGRLRLNDAYAWLASFSEEAADRFADSVSEALANLCADLAGGGDDAINAPRFDADASIYFSRKTYLLLVRTGKGRGRNTSGGVWRVFYDLADVDGDGVADTLRVVGVYHGVARPLGERVTDDEAEEDDSE